MTGVSAALVAEVAIGDTEAKVLAELGPPSGMLSIGTRKRVVYPAGSITYNQGVVTAIDPQLTAASRETKAPANTGHSGAPAASAVAASTPPIPANEARHASQGASSSTGLIRGFQLAIRLHDSPAEYFAGDARRAWAAAMAADPDEKTDPAAVIAYPPGSQSALLYVPPSYDGSRAFGVFLDVRPHDRGEIVDGYENVCTEHRLIWVAPDHAGNDEHSARRCALALDALASVKRKYRVDDARVYVGGFSGGGAIAGELAVLFPEYFRGAMVVARGVRLQPSPAGNGLFWPATFPYLNPRQLRSSSHHGLRVAFVTGPAT